MTMAEQRETDERVKGSWDHGFKFGFWVGLVCGGIVASAGFAVAAVKCFL